MHIIGGGDDAIASLRYQNTFFGMKNNLASYNEEGLDSTVMCMGWNTISWIMNFKKPSKGPSGYFRVYQDCKATMIIGIKTISCEFANFAM